MFFEFLKDKKGYLITYFLNFALIIYFYDVSSGHSVEILYPLAISVFILSIFLAEEFYKYYSFNKKAAKMSKRNIGIIDCYTKEEKNVIAAIRNIDRSYIAEIEERESENLKKNKFVSQWVHNMKTPVSVIDLIIQRMQMNGVSKEEGLKGIDDENKRLLNYLEQVLSVLRLDEFTKDYLPEEVNLCEMVREVVNERKNQFIYSSVFPCVEIPESVHVLTDRKWSKTVIDQIVSNAVKYSKGCSSDNKIIIKSGSIDEKVVLTIEDHGIGIPKQDLRRVFEPFFTGDNGRKFKNSSGIGLYIVKEIADRLNLKVDIDSEQGKGTRVKITYLAKL